ncbi:MAG: hypothetical protein GX228_05690 [Firmicutes bacterium]|nr:hypothetical protein [Bacillota bacterium]NLL88416.1 hypothetical protein [Bacillota bacterium]HKM17963.1 hypothetical protein [Limnochordia bacterium]
MKIDVGDVIKYLHCTFAAHEHDQTHSIWLNLWRFLIKIESPSLESIQMLRAQYANFIAPVCGVKPDAVIRFVLADSFLDFPLDTDYHGYTKADNSLLVAPFFIIRFSDDGPYFIEMVVEDGDESFLFSAMRAVAPYLAIRQGGTLMHASAVSYGDRLYAFIGQSGAGKSTVIKLLSQSEGLATALTDEAVMIEADGGHLPRLVGWGTPYGREHRGANLCVPLGYCFFLVQDTTTYLAQLRPTEAATRLMSNLWCINTLGGLAANALEIAVCISEQVPCYELHFELNCRFWEQIKQLTAVGSRS